MLTRSSDRLAEDVLSKGDGDGLRGRYHRPQQVVANRDRTRWLTMIMSTLLLTRLVGLVGLLDVVGYGNTGCGVFKRGVQN